MNVGRYLSGSSYGAAWNDDARMQAKEYKKRIDEFARIKKQRNSLLAALKAAVCQITSMSGVDHSCDPAVDVSEYEELIKNVEKS